MKYQWTHHAGRCFGDTNETIEVKDTARGWFARIRLGRCEVITSSGELSEEFAVAALIGNLEAFIDKIVPATEA